VTSAIRAAARTGRVGGRVTLVNASARFTERLRLHQTAAGERLADHALEEVLAGSGVRFVQGRVAGLDGVPVGGARLLRRDAEHLAGPPRLAMLGWLESGDAPPGHDPGVARLGGGAEVGGAHHAAQSVRPNHQVVVLA
jgi:hypothetical protein